jgi:hypothetical protein
MSKKVESKSHVLYKVSTALSKLVVAMIQTNEREGLVWENSTSTIHARYLYAEKMRHFAKDP